ncbi:MAG TPA: class I SAM-dependent methyltransferase [Nannocystaceae bacterium]|nr:class I SAM-dependent methyltransferase [Nannocystaceae bacterium]
MARQFYDTTFGGDATENYQKYFVPVIGGPIASDLVEVAALRPGERVLDVACGTGAAARLAAERVGPKGRVAGLDINPGMLAVARAVTPADAGISWYETGAEAMPLPDAAFDVVLCSMGLQFMEGKLEALREMLRVLVPGGRVALGVPGPMPPLFAAMTDGLAEHVDRQIARFMDAVFSMHDAEGMRSLFEQAGFRDVAVRRSEKTLRLPPAAEFLWQYLHCTPIAAVVATLEERRRAALHDEVCEKWQALVKDGALMLELGYTTVTARK